MTEIRVKARLAFNPPWEPTSINNGPPKFRARLMFDPDSDWGKESIKIIRATRKEVAVVKFKGKAKAEAILDTIKGDKNKESWFENDYRNQEGEVTEGFEGMFHLSTLADEQPLMLDRDRAELSKRDGRLYSGCYVVAKIDIWGQDNAHGKGMRATILGLQFWKDGVGFSGAKRAKVDDFEDLGVEDDDDDDAVSRASARRPADEDDEKPAPKKRRPPPPEDDDDDVA